MKEFLACSYSELTRWHFGFGSWIRNNILLENSPLYKLFNEVGITQKDDMSSIIIKLFYIYKKYDSIEKKNKY